jgi:hypothetical protein
VIPAPASAPVSFRRSEKNANDGHPPRKQQQPTNPLTVLPLPASALAQQQRQQQQLATPSLLRSMYATPFARFVTGFCDTAQNAAVKLPMYEMARSLGMPERWVEVRHDITHGEMPELRVLEESARDAVQWLWERFWALLDAGQSEADRQRMKAEVRELLKLVLKDRKDDVRSGKKELLLTDSGNRILEIIKTNAGPEVVADVLVQDKVILPNQKS